MNNDCKQKDYSSLECKDFKQFFLLSNISYFLN